MTMWTITIIGALLLGYLLALFLWWMLNYAPQALSAVWTAAAAPFNQITGASTSRARWQVLSRELNRHLHEGERPDDQLLEAAEGTAAIQLAHLWLRESTSRCLETHWALARGLGAEHMSEAALHPKAVTLRHRNVELAQFLAARLQIYPYPTIELTQLEVAVPRLAATCAGCPYLFVARQEAPHVCPSVQALGHDRRHAAADEPEIVDAEPVSEGDQWP